MSKAKNIHAVALGRKGGRSKSQKKSKQSAENLALARLARRLKLLLDKGAASA